jgi:hypothetical protein
MAVLQPPPPAPSPAPVPAAPSGVGATVVYVATELALLGAGIAMLLKGQVETGWALLGAGGFGASVKTGASVLGR